MTSLVLLFIAIRCSVHSRSVPYNLSHKPSSVYPLLVSSSHYYTLRNSRLYLFSSHNTSHPISILFQDSNPNCSTSFTLVRTSLLPTLSTHFVVFIFVYIHILNASVVSLYLLLKSMFHISVVCTSLQSCKRYLTAYLAAVIPILI